MEKERSREKRIRGWKRVKGNLGSEPTHITPVHELTNRVRSIVQVMHTSKLDSWRGDVWWVGNDKTEQRWVHDYGALGVHMGVGFKLRIYNIIYII